MQHYDGSVQNLNSKDLRERLEQFKEEQVYAYVIDTLRLVDGQYRQTASGPNFQGGVITLCTCKHRMRTFKSAKDWKNDVWIAGFTGLTHTGGQNLVYLMRIGKAFDDFRALWNDSTLARQVREIKSATHNPFGDFYEPFSGDTTDRLLPEAYCTPCANHAHIRKDGWHDDVDTEYYKKRTPTKNPCALLIGDRENSYIWQSPKFKSGRKVHQGQVKGKLADFLKGLDPTIMP
jgi:Nucleotide modification associated domain 2